MRAGEIARFHGEHPALRNDDRCIAKELAHGPAIQGRGHHQQPEIRTNKPLGFKAERQTNIGLQAPFVELIEENRAIPVKFRLVEQEPRENAFGDHLNTSDRSNFAVQSHPITDGRANRFSQ